MDVRYLLTIMARATASGVGTSEFFVVLLSPLLSSAGAYAVGHALLSSDQAVGAVTVATTAAAGVAAALYAYGRSRVKAALAGHASVVAQLLPPAPPAPGSPPPPTPAPPGA